VQTPASQRAPTPEAPAAAPAAAVASAPARGLTPVAVLALQRTAGNAAVTRMLARAPASQFNPEAVADDLERAIDQSDVADGWTVDADGLHATTRKVDAAKVIAALDGLTPDQIEQVESLYKANEGTTLENDLFQGGRSRHPSNLKPDARARIRALLRGTGAGKAAPDARLEADAAELHELLGGELGTGQRERLMALWRRPVAEIAAMDAISVRLFSVHPTFALPVRLRGLQLQRALALRAGDAARADALALEDERRELEALEARKDSGDMGMLERAGYEAKRRKLVDGIGAIVETNRQEALADRANQNRAADEAVRARLTKVLAARPEPAKTVGAALAETLRGNEAQAIAAPLVEGAARKVLEMEERHTTSSGRLAEVIHELRAAAEHDTQLELPKLATNARLLDPATAEDEFGKLVSARAGGYIKALIEAYDALKPADGRTWSAIVASADAGNREMLTALTESGGKLSPVDELHHAVAARDAAAIRQVLHGCRTEDDVRQLEKEYRDKFGTDLRQAIFRSETSGQAMDADGPPWMKTAAVHGRDAADVDELLNAPSRLDGAEEAAWTAAGGMREAAVTHDNAGTLGWLRELGDVPETERIMDRSAWKLELLHMQWIAAAADPRRQAAILAEMRRVRAALSGDAAAYEQDNARLADEIRSAVSLAVQIGLAVALPGVGSGLTGFIATSAVNVGASVAANAVIFGDKYDLDAMLHDLEGSLLGALGGKLGEDVAKLIVAEVAERAGIAAVRTARAAGRTPKLAAELGRLAEDAARARTGMRALVGGGSFVGATGLTTVITSENGFTYQAALTAFLAARMQAAKAARQKPAASAQPEHAEPVRKAGAGPTSDGVAEHIPGAPVIEESPEGGFPLEGPAPEPEPEPQGPVQEVEIDLDKVTPTAEPEPETVPGPGEQPVTPAPDDTPAEGDEAVPVPIHEQPTSPMPEGSPPGHAPAVPLPIEDQPTAPMPGQSDGVPEHIDDEPSGFSHAPSEGAPGRAGEIPVREAGMDDPDKTGKWQRPESGVPESPPEPGGSGPERAPGDAEPEIMTTLPDGSIVYGDPQQPLTRAEAEVLYDRLIGDTAYREAQVIQDLDTGECIVVQGSTIDTLIDPAARASFLEDRPWMTRWSTVRHYHPIGRGRVTPRPQRYPSVADLRGAQATAMDNFRPQQELLDFATERGRGSRPFGYDQTQTQPYWVGVPDASGVYRPRRFTDVYEYQLWYDQQT
jgi:hypothetical protein